MSIAKGAGHNGHSDFETFALRPLHVVSTNWDDDGDTIDEKIAAFGAENDVQPQDLIYTIGFLRDDDTRPPERLEQAFKPAGRYFCLVRVRRASASRPRPYRPVGPRRSKSSDGSMV